MKMFDFKTEPAFIVDNVQYTDSDSSREDFLSILETYRACGLPVVIFCNPIFDPLKQRVPEFKTEDDVINYEYSFFGNEFEARLTVELKDDFNKFAF